MRGSPVPVASDSERDRKGPAVRLDSGGGTRRRNERARPRGRVRGGVSPRHADYDCVRDTWAYVSIRMIRPDTLDCLDIPPRTDTHQHIRIRISNPQSVPQWGARPRGATNGLKRIPYPLAHARMSYPTTHLQHDHASAVGQTVGREVTKRRTEVSIEDQINHRRPREYL